MPDDVFDDPVQVPDDTDPGSTPEDQAATLPESPSAGEGDPDDVQTKTTDGDESPEYERFLAKYDGDHAKAGKAYWNSVRSAAQLYEENEQLKARLEARDKAPKRDPEPEEPHPDIAAIDTRLQALYKDLTESIPQAEAQLVKEHQSTSSTVAGLEARLADAKDAMTGESDPDRREQLQSRHDRLSAQVLAAKAALSALEAKYETLQERKSNKAERFNDLKGSRQRLAQRIERERAEGEAHDEERAAFRVEHRQRVSSTTEAAAKRHGVAYSEDVQQLIDDHLIKLLTPLHQRGVPAARIDWDGEIDARVKKLAGLIKGSTATTLAKPRQVVQDAAGRMPPKRPAPSNPGAPRSRDDLIKARAEKERAAYARLQAAFARKAG